MTRSYLEETARAVQSELDDTADLERRRVSQSSSGLFADLSSHFSYSAFQKPITGLSQALDGGTGRLVEATKFMDQPQDADPQSITWHLEQIAAGAGYAVPMAVSMLIARPLVKRTLGTTAFANAEVPVAKALANFSLKESAIAGFINNATFEPNENSADGLALTRMKQGVVGAVTFATMHRVSNALSGYTGAAAADATFITRGYNAGIAGGAGSLTGTIADAALNGKTIDVGEATKSAYSMMFTGSVLGATSSNFMRLNEPKLRLPELETHVLTGNVENSRQDSYISWLQTQTITDRAAHGAEFLASRFGLIERPSEYSAADMLELGLTGRQGYSRKFSDLDPVGRVRMLAKMERDSDSKFVNKENLDSFTDHMKIATKHWEADEISQALKDKRTAKDELRAASEDAHVAKLATIKDKNAPKIDWNDPDLTAALKKEEEARKATNKEWHDDSIYEKRGKDVTIGLNAFLRERGLPEVPVEFKWTGTAQGQYDAGKIYLHKDVLQAGEMAPQAQGILFHETDHLYRDVAKIKYIASLLKIGKNASTAELEQLGTYARYKSDAVYSHDFLTQVLNTQDHLALTQEQILEGKRTLYGDKNYAPPWLKEAETIEEQKQNIDIMLGAKSARTARAFIEINSDKMMEVMRSQYGFTRVPREIQTLASNVQQERALLGPGNFGQPAEVVAPKVNGFELPWESAVSEVPPNAPSPVPTAELKPAAPATVPLAVPRELDRLLPNANEENTFSARTTPQWFTAQPSSSALAAIPDSAITESFYKHLENRKRDIEIQASVYGSKGHSWYMRNYLERRAFPAGFLAFLNAERQKSSPEP